ncbi:MAG: polysaccharide pyruvyl transferase family protein [Clostridia bacterium]|nr:polysaccharide pyruvyl transferase family protein [Clostridia bacterium]
MNKVLIVGATYSDNFGDMLFAKIMADYLSDKCEFRYYLLSDYAQKFIGKPKIADFSISEAEALVYMPGGFFGDRHDTSLYTTYLWFKRYFPIGLKFAFLRKPMLILGVGAGPCKYGVMKRLIKYICKRANKVIVREDDSSDFLKTLGVDSMVTSDLAQTITDYELPNVQLNCTKKKKMLVHINQNKRAAEKVLPAVQQFYEKHREDYNIIVASDQVCPDDYAIYEKIKAFATEDAAFYKYGDPLELCSVIKQSDAVVTYKLHVGIVACSYGKSVIAIPEHYKKVERYYRHIGYSERVLPLYKANGESILNMLEEYAEVPIQIPAVIIDSAYKNFDELKKYIEALG